MNKIVISLTLLIVLLLQNPAYADSASESEIFYQRGRAYGAKLQYELAIIQYTKAIELNPQHEYAYNNRGAAYYHNLQYDLARIDLTKAIELNPQDDFAYCNRGDVYAMKGETANLAIADYTKAIELKPNVASYYYRRAIVYDFSGRHRLAVDDYNQVLKMRPNDNNAASAKRHLLTSYGGGHYYGEAAVYDTSFNPF